MKKTYIPPMLIIQRVNAEQMIAASINISNDTIVTDPDEAAVKDAGDWNDIWE